jgi:hypothetical protein
MFAFGSKCGFSNISMRWGGKPKTNAPLMLIAFREKWQTVGELWALARQTP